jgi:hypothetical protein
MDWNQIFISLIWPAFVAAIIGFGGLWLARRTP